MYNLFPENEDHVFFNVPFFLPLFQNGFTPLHVACKKMKVKIAEILLKKGANVDATTQVNSSPQPYLKPNI